MALAAAENSAFEPLIHPIEQMAQGSLEPAGDFCLMGLEREIGRDDADNRRDRIAADRPIFVELADYFDLDWIQPKLFESLAKRGIYRSFARIGAAAGEGDLPRVSPH